MLMDLILRSKCPKKKKRSKCFFQCSHGKIEGDGLSAESVRLSVGLT